ncbi:MAG: sensor histidine kinase [Chloroflexota bacterium]
MTSQPFDTLLFIVYFIYGLAFWGMGLTLALESGRSPALAEAKILRPLAIFGLLHGTHEWLESYLLQAQYAGTSLPAWWAWLRLGLLVLSFIFLLGYGIRSFTNPDRPLTAGYRVGLFALGFYGLAILASAGFAYSRMSIDWRGLLDVLSRYLLAAPGAALAALALQRQAAKMSSQGRRGIAVHLMVAAVSFGVYALAQVVVNPTAMVPAQIINTANFREFFGFPIQAVRAVAAVLITLSVLRATQIVEKERQEQLFRVQKDRLEALERIQEEMRMREEMRRELVHHIVQAQEDERARIARELHDETSQTLAAFSLDLASLQIISAGDDEVTTLAKRLQDLSRQMAHGLYRLVHDLRPAQLDDLGLVAALEHLADHCCPNGLVIDLDVRGRSQRLDPLVETVLYRVAQEAMQNVHRHAKTSRAIMLLSYTPDQVVLQVRDRGVGFNPQTSFTPPHGWGLTGMRERIESAGGRLNLHSAPGEGTIVEAVIPIGNEESSNTQEKSTNEDDPIDVG